MRRQQSVCGEQVTVQRGVYHNGRSQPEWAKIVSAGPFCDIYRRNFVIETRCPQRQGFHHLQLAAADPPSATSRRGHFF
jgi:hypothetical protein